MTGEFLAIGVDPGPIPGIVALRWSDGLLLAAEVVQCTPGLAPSIVTWLLADPVMGASHPDLRAVVQVERFVVGRSSGRSGKAGATTRDLVGAIQREVGFHAASVSGFPAAVVLENAQRVKTWASDLRLMEVIAAKAAGNEHLYALTAGMRHARDGARHAVFASVMHGGVPDPLSKGAHRG